jgi:phage tail sheath protein FI
MLGWKTIFNAFENFAKNVRKDCIFISDPLRQIFVNGENTKRINLKNSTFNTTIYSPLKKLYSTANSSYAVTYGNWVRVYDTAIDKPVWVPASGFVAATYARTDFDDQPWIAPAGLSRGVLSNILDIGFNPNQKQRDFLYTIAINPIVFFPSDGYAVFGQKTLQKKPSAFDRVNVRRLFLTLEKATTQALKYFVFEPNSEFTRTRVVNTLDPIFENAKNTEGLYDYLIVCDERNNTDANIDNNELLVDIYIKPVKAAEFILVNFIATRTGQSFEELI